MPYEPSNPLIVQSDKTILLEVNNPRYDAARDALARFAELEKSPEHIHTYRITPLSLWNAAAAGDNTASIIDALERFGKYDLPANVHADIAEYVARYGRVKLVADGAQLRLVSDDPALLVEIAHHRRLAPLLGGQSPDGGLVVDPAQRGHVKQALLQFGYPPEDLAGYVAGAPLDVALRASTLANGAPFALRRYQADAVAAFHAAGTARGGSGVIVLPSGAGKTVVGLGAIAELNCQTLILTPSTVAARQWIQEITDKTHLPPEAIGEYSGEVKQIRPITVTTYQALTYRPSRDAEFPHFTLFNERDWGLIIYDEVHLLPAPVFRVTAGIQARRRLGLTATLVREDGRETDVFSLIGPKRYDVPWKDLERQGWIATAACHEIRVRFPDDRRMTYALADERERFRIAAENPAKLAVLDALVAKHPDDSVLIIGQYLDQLATIAARYGAPLITGKTPTLERQDLYQAFRVGTVRLLVVSKVANFAIDLPDAGVALQVSGTFGSRQEEAQRLGRILRPKRDGRLAHFYSLVTRDTRDQDFAANRQKFLTEQGYRYEILYEQEIDAYEPVRQVQALGETASDRPRHLRLVEPDSGWMRAQDGR
ncbi:MAG TPA: DNA repair helicase XPB [Thermomicrobiaceae bacterium]|nr:DNA repair helicase XPB [Thermomicrobiaceae bacterium]